MKLIIIKVIERPKFKDKKDSKVWKFNSFNWGVNRGEKLEFRAKMVKFANQ
jgi:hypothetical protein